MKTAIVVGAGLAGLSAAYRLKQAGWQVTVLEKTERLCGRVISFEKQGYLIDGCATSISSTYLRYIALLREIGMGDQLVEASNVFGVVREGKAYYVDALKPARSFLGTPLMSVAEKARFILGALRLKKYMRGVTLADPAGSVVHDSLSIDSVARRCFGNVLIDTLMDPLMRVVTFGSVRDTTSVELFTGLTSASGRYLNVLGGLEALPRALARHVDVKLGATAQQVVQRGEGVEVRYTMGDGAEKTETVDACVIASSFPQAVAMCPQLGIEAPLLAQQTGFAESFVVHLGYTMLPSIRPAAIALPRQEFPNNPAIFLDHNKAPDRAPPGHSLFTVYYCPEAVPLLKTMPEEKILADARALIERFFPEIAGRSNMGNVKYAPYGSHLAPPGYFAAVQQYFANHPATHPIQVGGDYFSLPSQETAVAWGERAAQRIIEHRS